MNFKTFYNLNEGIFDIFKKDTTDYEALYNQYLEDWKNIKKDVEWAKHTDYKTFGRRNDIPKTPRDDEYLDECVDYIKKELDKLQQVIASGNKKDARVPARSLCNWLNWHITTTAWGLYEIFTDNYINWDLVLNNKPSEGILEKYRENTKQRDAYLTSKLTPSAKKTFGGLIDEL